MNLTEKYLPRVKVKDDQSLNKKGPETTNNNNKSPVYNTIDNSAVKIYSEKIHQELWLVKDVYMQQRLIEDGVDLPVFTFAEIGKMDEALSDNALQQIYNMKKIFEGSSIGEVSKDEPLK